MFLFAPTGFLLGLVTGIIVAKQGQGSMGRVRGSPWAEGKDPAHGFDLPLRVTPRATDESWTDWLPAPRGSDAGKPRFSRYQVSYQVQQVTR